MKRTVALFLLGAFVPMLQGVAAYFLPARWVPDLGLLLVVALGLCWRTVGGGMALSCAIGFVADLLSGSLLGQHALLRMFAFGAARVGSQALNLRGPLPQAVFVAGLTVVNAGAFGALTAFFTPGPEMPWVVWRDVGPQALVNSIAAPIVAVLTAALVRTLSDDDAGRRLLRLEPRNRLA